MAIEYFKPTNWLVSSFEEYSARKNISKWRPMELEKKLNLIKRNLQEIIDEKKIEEILTERNLSIYWGTAITGRPHIAYFLPIMKIRDFLEAGCTVKILLADIHGFLDNMKAPIEKVGHRLKYYERLLIAVLTRLGVDTSNVIFIKGSDFQKSPEYAFDLYRISSYTTVHSAVRAGAQVVKQAEDPLLSSLLYPNMQALDEEYLKVDAQFGGVDQRKIFMHANKYLPKLGYKRRIHLMNPMMPGLEGKKMSSSEESSKIDFIDSEKSISKKVNATFCEVGNTNSGVLVMFKHVIFPLNLEQVKINDVIYESYDQLEKGYLSGALHPMDIKKACAEYLNSIIAPIRDEMLKDPELIRNAYN